MPKDLKKEAGDFFKKLKNVLKAEDSSDEWKQELVEIEEQFHNAVMRTRNKRIKKRISENTPKDEEIDSIVEVGIKNDAVMNLYDEILEAKYKNSPQWKRFERLFNIVKEDTISAIEKTSYDEKIKTKMKKQIESVGFSLPYYHDTKLGAEYSCSTTTVNAFYNTLKKKFTACMGFVNSYKSDSAVYTVMAHELAHSIDPNEFFSRDFYENGKIYKLLKPLLFQDKPVYSCKDWNDRLSEINNVQKKLNVKKHDYEKFYACLDAGESPEPVKIDDIFRNAKIFADKKVAAYAQSNDFSDLIKESFKKNNKIKKNKYYRNPQRAVLHNAAGIQDMSRRDPDVMEIFNQVYECADSVKTDAEKLKWSIEQTKAIITASYSEYMSTCGNRCAALVGEGLAKEVGEPFADWLAARATAQRVGRLNDLSNKREALSLSFVLFCKVPSVQNDAPELTAIEKEYSMEAHSEGAIRRISIFNSQNAALAECEMNSENAKRI